MNSTEMQLLEMKVKNSLQNVLESIQKEQKAIDELYTSIAKEQLLEKDDDTANLNP